MNSTAHTFKPSISVIIPNYNGMSLFPHTLQPLMKVMRESGLLYEIIISDDCSTDQSVAFLKENFPEIKVIESKVNKGFSGACNNGIKNAKYDLVLLLNSDIILTDGYFEHQLKYFDSSDTFGVMGRIIGWHDEIIQDAARYPAYHGLKIKTSVNYLIKPMGEQPLFTFYLSGANALVDRKKLLALGGFDEIYSPFYIEDCDLSLRAWHLGWKCYYEHQAICRHQTSTTVKAKNKKRFVEKVYNRNKYFFHAIHLSRTQLPLWFMQVCAEVLFRTLSFRFTYLQAFISFIKRNSEWRASRRRLHELKKSVTGSLTLQEFTNFIVNSLQGKQVIKFKSSQLKEEIK